VAPSVQRRKVWLTPTTRVLCSNAAKTRNPLKSGGCPKLDNRSLPLVGQSSPYYQNMWRRYCCLTIFFPIVDTCLSSEDIARQSCAMVPKWRFFASCISASRVQHISDMHSKFALRPHHVWKYGRHPSNLRPLRLGEEKKKIDRKKPQGKNIMVCPITQGLGRP